MKAIFAAYRTKYVLSCIVLTFPWVWSVFFIPWWVSVASACMIPIAGVLMLLYVFPPPPASRRATDKTVISDEEIQRMRQRRENMPRRASDSGVISNEEIKKMRESSAGLHNLLVRWAAVSQNTRGSLQEVQHNVDEVMKLTEGAVVSISNSFLAITQKTNSQMEYAMSLLKSTRDAEDATLTDAKEMSLPDYIRAYEGMLNIVTQELNRFSQNSLDVMKHQEKVRENSKIMDELLDEVTSLANQISRLALNSSVSGGGAAADQRVFVEMTDKVRGLSQNANDLSRKIRQYLEGIKQEILVTHNAMHEMANEAKEAVVKAKMDSSKLIGGMMMKNQEVADILERTNALGEEIRTDINKIIISMQFQDITQQKLERLKHPVLSEVTQALRVIFDETRILNNKLDSGVIDVPGIPSGTFKVVPSVGRRSTDVQVEAVADKPAVSKPENEARALNADGGKFELF